MDDDRHAHRARRRQRGIGRIAAKPGNDFRLRLLEILSRIRRARPQLEGRRDQLVRQLRAKRRRLDFQSPVSRKIGRIFLAALIRHQRHLPAARMHLVGEGLRGKHMSARAAGGDNNERFGGVGHRCLRCESDDSGCLRVSASASPSVNALPSNDDPPEDTSGNVIPFGGMSDRFTDMFTAACNPKIA